MTTVAPRKPRTGYAYGDVTCLNCGRMLAAAVQRLHDGAIAIRPLASGEQPAVDICAGSRLRCRCCGGRAFVEFDEIATRRTGIRADRGTRVA
ncbi:MAG: hypothetical protein ACYDCQ_02975 [Dehalococcoidia bacterium]